MSEHTLNILSAIGYEITAQSVAEELKDESPDKIIVNINSPGGIVWEAIAIYNILVQHEAEVEVNILGAALSAAANLAMAGNSINMAENARMMIHNPYTFADGDAEQMRKVADNLDALAKDIAQPIADKSGMTLDEVLALMDEETWFTADEAKEKGLIDNIVPAKTKVLNIGDLAGYKHPPQVKEPVFDGIDEAKQSFKYAACGDRKFQVKIDGNINKYTKAEVMTLNEIQDELGVDSPEKAMAAIKSLKEEAEGNRITMTGDSAGDQVAQIIAENKTLTEKVEANEAKNQLLQEQIEENNKRWDELRNNEFKAKVEWLISEGFVKTAQKDKIIKAYENDPEGFKNYCDLLEEDEPRYKNLTKPSGVDGDEKTYESSPEKGSAVAQEVSDKIKSIRANDKDLTYSAAYEKLRADEPDLVERYENNE